MHSTPFFLLSATAFVWAAMFPPTGQAQTKREVATTLQRPGYLSVLNSNYYVDAEVPGKAATDVPTQVVSFSVKCEFSQKGPAEIRDMKLDCQGVTYAVPTYKVLVLDDPSKTPGLSILTAPDPNHSGNVELIVDWNDEKNPKPDYINVCDSENRHKGIDVLRVNGSGGGSDEAKHYEWFMEVLLRNTTETPYVLGPEFFKNVPAVKNWPEIIIPPAKDE